jgi:nucleoside-diphosphate-sugar epimerase
VGPKPVVLITGAAGDIGSALAEALADDNQVVGFERSDKPSSVPLIEVDLVKAASIRAGVDTLRERYGSRLASVIHLAAYFDVSAEHNPRYQSMNIDGTQTGRSHRLCAVSFFGHLR